MCPGSGPLKLVLMDLFVKPHELLFEHLKARNVTFNVTKQYKAEGLFVGASITLDNPQVSDRMLLSTIEAKRNEPRMFLR